MSLSKLAPVSLVLVTSLRLVCAQNLYPDAGFEQTGVVGDAHSGQKVGCLKVGDKQRWVSLGGPLTVEPFATYRASAWVKVKRGSGGMYGLYCYEWNSFDWAFSGSAIINDLRDWTKVEVMFVSPCDRIQFHPLAFIDGEHAEAWVDDVVVEKVKDAEDTVMQWTQKPNLSMEEIQYVARWYVAQGVPDKARALMNGANDYTKADIACLLAKHSRDVHERAALTADMVQYGGLSYANGMTRFQELTAEMQPNQRLTMCERILLASPDSLPSASAYRDVVQECMGAGSGAYTCADREQRIGVVATSVARVLAGIPADAKTRKEVEGVSKVAAESLEIVRQLRASLGRCVIRVGGQAWDPKTHAIVTPNEPTAQEEHAARDLQGHLELLTGELFPIVKDDEAGNRTPIVIGRSSLIGKLGVRSGLDSLGPDGLLIKNVGPALVLAGNQRGVLYVTYTFLEDFLGVHWLSSDCTIHPQKGTFNLDNLNVRYVPPLEYREPFAFCGYHADWAVRNKSNGSATRLDRERGDKIKYKGFVHTFYGLVPPESYFAEHLEYFSEIDGQRRHEYAQLCLTNPEVEDRVVEAVRQWLKESPETNIVSVSQNDWAGNCQCAKCKAIDDEEGSPAGSLLRFVNRVAERLEKEFPNVAIDTLAYQYTRKPPKITKPRSNVIVRLCSIECSFAQPLGKGKQNVAFKKDIEGWGKICKRLYVWDYVTNFAHYIQPHPNLRVLQPNIQFFTKNGIKGIFEQGGYQSPGGEMQELRTWLLAKLLWNPKADVEKLLPTFLEGYYGAAAPFIREYLDLMHDEVEKTETYLACYTSTDAEFLRPEVIARADALFDQAEKSVRNDAALLKRVQTARLPVLYVHIARDKLKFREENDALVASQTDKSAWIEQFERSARAAGVTHIREGASNLDEWLTSAKKQTATLRIERLKNENLDVAILPEFGGRIWRMRYLPTGKDILLRVGEEDSLQPGEGGYEEYSEFGYKSPGWNETYRTVERTGNAVVLQTDLRNGLRLHRRIELDPHKPKVYIVSTVSNPGSGSITACLRVHPGFSVADTQKATVWTRQQDGAWRKHSLANPADPLAEKELWFRGDTRPYGEWAVVDDTDGIALISRFSRDQLGLCYLNWSGKQKRVNLELWSPSVTLKAGESVRIEHEYEVTPSLPSG